MPRLKRVAVLVLALTLATMLVLVMALMMVMVLVMVLASVMVLALTCGSLLLRSQKAQRAHAGSLATDGHAAWHPRRRCSTRSMLRLIRLIQNKNQNKKRHT